MSRMEIRGVVDISAIDRKHDALDTFGELRQEGCIGTQRHCQEVSHGLE